MALGEDEDPQLAAALLRSIQEQGRHKNSSKDIVDLTGDSDNEPQGRANHTVHLDEDDEDDDDLEKAIALSLQQSSFPDDPEETPKSSEVAQSIQDAAIEKQSSEHPPASKPSDTFGILGLDRKKLEEERLARVAKRKAEQEISPPPFSREQKVAKYTVTSSDDAPKPLVLPQSSDTQMKPRAPSTGEKRQVPITPSSIPGIEFPKGIVKKTWLFQCPRMGDDIKIEEVFQCSDLELAVLSAFQFDIEWLFRKFQTSNTRLMLMMQAKDEITVSAVRQN